jgi:hypothetical protein
MTMPIWCNPETASESHNLTGSDWGGAGVIPVAWLTPVRTQREALLMGRGDKFSARACGVTGRLPKLASMTLARCASVATTHSTWSKVTSLATGLRAIMNFGPSNGSWAMNWSGYSPDASCPDGNGPIVPVVNACGLHLQAVS